VPGSHTPEYLVAFLHTCSESPSSYILKCVYYVKRVKACAQLDLSPYKPCLSVKVHPITGHQWPRGRVKVQLYSFSTSTLEGGGWLAPRPSRFTPGKDPVQEAGWTPGPVCEKNLASTAIRSTDRPARSQSLYRLSYRAHIVYLIFYNLCLHYVKVNKPWTSQLHFCSLARSIITNSEA
jgi:hypothetical protein